LKYDKFESLAKERASELTRPQLEAYYSQLLTSRRQLKGTINAYQVVIAVLLVALLMTLTY